MRKLFFLGGVASSSFVFGHLIIGLLVLIAMGVVLVYSGMSRIEKKLQKVK